MTRKLSDGARPHSRSGRLGIERLERKDLLAGDVVVSVVHGRLVVEGDAEANQIAVSSGDAAGTYVIRGLEGTTVRMADSDDAAPETGLVVERIRGDVRIAMGDGDDLVRINDASFRRNLGIALGEGNDRVLVGLPPAGGVEPSAEVEELDAAAMSDADVNVRGAVRILGGEGDDVVRVADAAIGGYLSVAADGGADRVVLGADPEAAAVDAEAAEGDDGPHLLRARGGVFVALGDGEDAASLTDVGALRGVAVLGGEGSDRIALRDVDAGFSLLVRGGRGEAGDKVVLEDVASRFALVATGDGADDVRIADSAFSALTVATGCGDDVVGVSATKARLAVLLGGDGQDTLNEAGDNQFGTKVVRNFEVPPPEGDAGITQETLAGRLARLIRRRR